MLDLSHRSTAGPNANTASMAGASLVEIFKHYASIIMTMIDEIKAVESSNLNESVVLQDGNRCNNSTRR